MKIMWANNERTATQAANANNDGVPTIGQSPQSVESVARVKVVGRPRLTNQPPDKTNIHVAPPNSAITKANRKTDKLMIQKPAANDFG